MAGKNGITVSVVVVTKNEEKNIRACLDSLLTQDFSSDEYEILVVDALSTDKTQEIVCHYPVKLIVDDYGTLAHQRNMGLENARGDYVAFTDADCIVDQFWLKELVAAIRAGNSEVVAATGPNLIFKDDPFFSRVVGHMQETIFGSGGSPQSYRITKMLYNVISAPNCNVIYRREVVLKEKYDNNFIIGEDADLNYRLRCKGFKIIFVPQAFVWHHRVNSFRKFVKKMYLWGEAMGIITRKYKKPIRWYAFLPSMAILLLIITLIFLNFYSWLLVHVLLIFVVYICGIAFFALQAYPHVKIKGVLLIMLLLPVQHFVYGLGFLRGLFKKIEKGIA